MSPETRDGGSYRLMLKATIASLVSGRRRDAEWTNGVLTIIGSDSRPQGTGFVVSESGLIATSSHVLDRAGWPYEAWDRPVGVRFLATNRWAEAHVIEGLHQSQVDGDIALLQLDGELPDGVRTLRLVQAEDMRGHQVYMRGYPAQNREGLAGHGKVVDEIMRNGRKELQIESTNTTFGYSGGPVWNEELEGVIGMIVARPDVKPGERLEYTNYAAKAKSIVELSGGRLELEQLGEVIEPQTRAARRTVILATIASVLLISIALLIVYLALRPEPVLTEPRVMERLFNVAVADFGEIDDLENGPVQESKDGRYIANQAFLKLEEGLKDVSELAGDVDLQQEYVGVIAGNTPQERRVAAAKLAKDIRADIVIYGNINSGRLPATFVPKFYVSPRLTGAEESTGSSAFGSEILVDLPLDRSDNRAALVAKLVPRYEAMTEFIYGLAFFKKGLSDEALNKMELATSNDSWDDREGKEILYLWLGSAYHQRVMNPEIEAPRPCEWAEGAPSDDWACAQAAYDRSLNLNESFARAQLGLGNLWLEQATHLLDGRPMYLCDNYYRAIDLYEETLGEDMSAADTAYLELKTYYNTGLAYAKAYFNCDEANYEPAVDNLSKAAAEYHEDAEVLLVRDIGAKAYYQLGLVKADAGNFVEAVDAFEQARQAAEPDDQYEDKWQSIRWQALSQKGYAFIALAEEGDATRWSDAVEAFEQVAEAYREQRFSHPVVMGTVFLGLGTAQNQLEEYDAAKSSVETAIRFAELAEESDPQWAAYTQRDSYMQLGHILFAMAESGDKDLYDEALAYYRQVVDAHLAGSRYISADDSAVAQYHIGQVYEALGQQSEAKESYQKLLEIEGVRSNIFEQARDRLSELNGQ